MPGDRVPDDRVPSSRVLASAAAALGVGAAGLTARVAVAGDVPGDRRVLRGLRSAVGDRWDGALLVVDELTDSRWLVLLAAALAVALVRAHRPRTGLLVAAGVLGVVAGNPLLKRLVDRPRPDLLLLDGVSPLSLPSGHAAGSAALALAAVLAAAGTRWLVGAVTAALALVAVTALVQLALARHYPSDVLAGWAWATAATCALWAVGGRPPRG